MKRFSILNPALNTTEIGAGAGHFNNIHILDIGFRHLGLMGLKRLHLGFQSVGYIDKYVRIEILSCWSFVKQHVADVTGGRHDGLG